MTRGHDESVGEGGGVLDARSCHQEVERQRKSERDKSVKNENGSLH